MKYQNRGERNEAVIIISYNVAYDIDSDVAMGMIKIVSQIISNKNKIQIM